MPNTAIKIRALDLLQRVPTPAKKGRDSSREPDGKDLSDSFKEITAVRNPFGRSALAFFKDRNDKSE